MTSRGFDDEELRAAYQAWADGEDAGDTSEDAIWQAVDGELTAAERRALVHKLSEFPGDGLRWRLVRELRGLRERQFNDDAEAKIQPFPSGTRSMARYLSGATAAVLLIAISSWFVQISPVNYRAPTRITISSILVKDEELSRHAFRLAWSSAGPTARYDVRVMTDSFDEITSATDLTQTHFNVKAPALQGIVSGMSVNWQVRAHFPDGSQVISPTFVVKIK
ncbi:MAG: hypothetical protein KTR25_00345 [Myxococcales bacterium]|nr:hypothetical protein [Myxococcales bacterium]